MKKLSLFAIGFLVCSSVVFADSVEEKVFVQPFVSKVAKGNAGAAKVVALNVGTNIPSGLIATKEGTHGLNSYMADIAKKMEAGGMAVISAPASYDVVFTDGTMSYDEIYKQMDEILAKIGVSKDSNLIVKALSSLKGVNHATFVQREDALVLVTDKKALKIGETIYRKTPEGVSQDIYHTEEEYLVAFKNAGLICEEIARPSFFGEIKWKLYNDSHKKESLGAAYIENNPITLYHIKKA